MKNNTILLALVFALFLSSCENQLPEKKQVATPTFTITAYDHPVSLNEPGQNVYFNVTGFDSKDKECFLKLKKFAKDVAYGFKLPVTVHFMDNVPNFEPPASGKFYGTEELRKKVILQYVMLANHSTQIYFDPLGYGSYVEPTD